MTDRRQSDDPRMKRLTIGLIGDYDATVLAHQAIPKALAMAAGALGLVVEARWVGTETLDSRRPSVSGFDGIWCVPGSPYRNTSGAIAVIKASRERGISFLGTCGGFQHALLEGAASLWGLKDSGHAELDPMASEPVISPLTCSLIEQSGRVRFLAGSKLAAAYGCPTAEEGYHCSYGLNPRFAHHLERGPLRATAWDDAGEVRGVELEGHRFFVATLFQPERAALKQEVSPVVRAFLQSTAADGGGRAG